MEDSVACDLRRCVSEISNAVEAHIRGEPGAREKIRKSTQQLQIAGMGPAEFWAARVWQPLQNVCLVMAQEMKIVPIINGQTDGITAAAIAQQTGFDELLIVRIMRNLTSAGICDESGAYTYRSNQLSNIAASLGGQAGVKITNELLFPVAARLVPYMREHGFKQFPRRPKEMDLTQYTFGGKMMWEYFKDNHEMKQWFDTLMAENRAHEIPWSEIYPFADEVGKSCINSPDKVLLVDVGGNRGADIIECREAFPSLAGRFVLQDLPETLETVNKSNMQGIEVQPYDFFTPQPVKGAKVYFLRWILHDWDDDSIRKFLPNTVQAIDKDSILLLQELVIPDFGANLKASHLDVLMMLYHSGMERTLNQWKALMESCGLEIVKVWSQPGYDPCLIECKVKDN